jgi:integrase
VVFTRQEVKNIFLHLEGTIRITGQLLYGAGLRLMECIRLPVKDIDFGYNQIVVLDGKGHKDRITILPENTVERLHQHLEKVKQQQIKDLKAGFDTVFLTHALMRKYPQANRDWGWQYVFPATKRSVDTWPACSLSNCITYYLTAIRT